jgi:hypothetical protein
VTQGGAPDRGRPAWQQGDRGAYGNGDGNSGGNSGGTSGGRPNTPPAWSGRPAWQQGGNPPAPNTPAPNAPAPNGRPAWQQGQSGSTAPSWGGQGGNGRNPTYADPARNPTYRPQPGRDEHRDDRNVDHTNDHSASWSKDRDGKWYRDTGWQWRQDGRGQWYRDHADNWGRDNTGKWYRNGNGANTGRGNDWNRGNNGWGNNGYNNNGWGNNGYGRRDWDRDGWRRDNRYNWFGWRNDHRDVFRGGAYYAPYRDYSYSRLSIGIFLGDAFYDQRYWIDDPYAYRLPPAYEPYRWVRYYDDVLLIDTYSGEVVDVIYDFFD